MSSDHDQPEGTVHLDSGGSQPGDESVSVWDMAPDNPDWPPGQFQATASRADELIDLDPKRYRLAIDGEAAPLERSDRKQVDQGADQ
jgi:hypothetical protein